MTDAGTITDRDGSGPMLIVQVPTLGPLGLPASAWLWARRLVMATYVVATYLLLKSRGNIPADREIIVGWIAGLALLATVGRRRHEALVTLASWAPFLLALFLYDFARAVGHWLDRPVAVRPQISIDRFLGGGKLWTERLQGWLIDKDVGLGRLPVKQVESRLRNDSSTIHWYDVGVSITYQSHFIVPYLTAGVLWKKGQRLWRWYAATFVFVTFASCVVFALYATAPPWWAARLGLINDFPRVIAGRGWSRVGLRFATRIIQKGQDTVNPFAAIPSLHSAEALMVTVFLWHFTWKWLRPLLALLPLAMGFTLVYSGEHYLIDVFVGWGMVGIGLGLGAFLRRRYGWKSPWTDGPKFEAHTASFSAARTASAVGDGMSQRT